jgi:hypothetical protein
MAIGQKRNAVCRGALRLRLQTAIDELRMPAALERFHDPIKATCRPSHIRLIADSRSSQASAA